MDNLLALHIVVFRCLGFAFSLSHKRFSDESRCQVKMRIIVDTSVII